MVKAAVSAKRFRAAKHGAPADPVHGITADAMCPLLAIVDIGVDKVCLDIEDKTRLESANNRGVGYDLSNNLHQAESNSASNDLLSTGIAIALAPPEISEVVLIRTRT